MAALTAHLRRSEDHGTLPFHPDCPICLAERLSGTLPAHGLVGRRTQAAVVAGLLAASTATPTVAIAQEADQVTEGTVAPEQANADSGATPDFDPGGDSADLPLTGPEVPDIETEPVDDIDAPLADTGDAPVPPPVSAPAPTIAAPPAAPTPAPTSPPAPSSSRTVPALQTPGARSAAPHLALEATADRARAPRAQHASGPSVVHVVTAPPPARAVKTGDGDRYHVVAAGDSLWSIARAMVGSGAPPAAIAREVNRLWTLNSARIATGDPDLLRVGTKLALR